MSDTMTVAPTLGPITRCNGTAGRVAYSVSVTYGDAKPITVCFVGSVYGGPVYMVTRAFPDGVYVDEPSRFGRFRPNWVRSFYGIAVDDF